MPLPIRTVAWRCGEILFTWRRTMPIFSVSMHAREPALGRHVRGQDEALWGDERSPHCERRRHCRHIRRRFWRARLPGSLRCADGETEVAFLDDPRARGIRLRELARRFLSPRWRHDLDAGHVRS